MWKIQKIVSKGDYNYAVIPEHPNCTKNGYVLEHRVVIENSLGRLLNSGEVVHHINGDKKDNRLENLQLLSPNAHIALHSAAAGRKVVTLRCPECGTIFRRMHNNSYLAKGNKYSCCSASCRGKFSRKVQLHGLTHEVELAISENLVAIEQILPTTPSKP